MQYRTTLGCFTVAALVLLSGCEPFPASEEAIGASDTSPIPVLASGPPAAVPADQVTTLRMGAPDGVLAIPPVPGAYSEAELAAAAASINAVQFAAGDLMNLAARASGWEEAEGQIRTYLGSPPERAAAAPAYLLEQIEVMALLSRPDFLDGALSSQEAGTAERLLAALVRNRSGDVDAGLQLLRALDGHVTTEQRQAYAQGVLRGDADYGRRSARLLAMVQSACGEDCIDDPAVRSFMPADHSARTGPARAGVEEISREG